VPVSNLLCEGEHHSPDARLLRSILKGVRLEIIPSGGKDGFPNTVFAWRHSNPNVCAFRDNDFPRDHTKWTAPCLSGTKDWNVRRDDGDHKIGWKWCRKEIENYFIDPDVLRRVLGWDDVKRYEYVRILERVFDDLACTTAARIALTCCAPKRNRVDTQMPLEGSPADMKARLATIAQKHNNGALLDVQQLEATFDSVLPECQSGGRFRMHALHVYAGKNILDKMQQTSGVPAVLKNKDALFERVLTALEQDQSPHTWIPEWTAIRDAVITWTPTPTV